VFRPRTIELSTRIPATVRSRCERRGNDEPIFGWCD